MRPGNPQKKRWPGSIINKQASQNNCITINNCDVILGPGHMTNHILNSEGSCAHLWVEISTWSTGVHGTYVPTHTLPGHHIMNGHREAMEKSLIKNNFLRNVHKMSPHTTHCSVEKL